MTERRVSQSSSPATEVSGCASTAPPRKPRRPACASCRVRKIRCSGPSQLNPDKCAACISHDRLCEWPTRRRSKRKRGDIENEIANFPQQTLDVASFSPMPLSHLNQPVDAQVQPGNMPMEAPTPLSTYPNRVSLATNRSGEDDQNVARVMSHPPSETETKVHYHRVSGNTAVHPGVNRISLKFRKRLSEQPPSGFSTANIPQQFDTNTNLPLPSVYEPLLVTFFEIYGQHFPSIQPDIVYARIAKGTMPSFLLNAMCALAARFQPAVEGPSVNAGNGFVAMALQNLVSLLRLPSTDTVTGLLLLAWADFGQNFESGHWQFGGLAIRMAVDLGLHRSIDALYEGVEHARRIRDLFWSVFLTDRLLSMSAGRACTIPVDIISVPLPPIDPPPSYPLAFLYSVQLMEKVGRIGDLLNGSRGTPGTFWTPTASPLAMSEALQGLQNSLVTFYTTLPDQVAWSAENFQRETAKHHGGIFLFFHLWANAMISLTYHPAVLHKPRGSDTPLTQRMDHSIELSIASSRNVCECIALADAISDVTYTGTPQVTQALYFAGLAFAYQLRLLQASEPTSARFAITPLTSLEAQGSSAMLTRLARQNLRNIIKSLSRIEVFWAGAGPVRNVLQQRANGLRHATIDFTSSSEAVDPLFPLSASSLSSTPRVPSDQPLDSVADMFLGQSFIEPGVGSGLETDSWSWQNLFYGSVPPDLLGDAIQPFTSVSEKTDFSAWMSSFDG